MKKHFHFVFTIAVVTVILVFTGFIYVYDQAPTLVVFPEKMNVFYVGVDNAITISATGVLPEQLMPTVDGGIVTPGQGGRGNFNVRINTTALWETTLRVKQKVDSIAEKDLGSYKFRIKKVPDPLFFVGSHSNDDSVFPKELASQKGVFARMYNFDFDYAFNVLSYSMDVFHDGKWKDMKTTGPEFSPEMKEQLQLLNTGDRLMFRDVLVKTRYESADSAVRHIKGINLIVK